MPDISPRKLWLGKVRLSQTRNLFSLLHEYFDARKVLVSLTIFKPEMGCRFLSIFLLDLALQMILPSPIPSFPYQTCTICETFNYAGINNIILPHALPACPLLKIFWRDRAVAMRSVPVCSGML